MWTMPCPFCGNEETLRADGVGPVECMRCHAKGPITPMPKTEDNLASVIAFNVAAWNCRRHPR
jgi:hypothetical protein